MLWNLLEPGDTLVAWDEFYDNDEEQWFPVPHGRVGGTAKRGDVIRRNIGDITPAVTALLFHLEALRAHPVEKRWMDVMEQYVAEIKRRMGRPSIGTINEDGSVEPTAMKKASKIPTLGTLFKDEH